MESPGPRWCSGPIVHQVLYLRFRQLSVEDGDLVNRPGSEITGKMSSRADNERTSIRRCPAELLFTSRGAVDKERDIGLPVMRHGKEGPLVGESDFSVGEDGPIVVPVFEPSITSDPRRIVVRVRDIHWPFCHERRPGSPLAIPPQPEAESVRPLQVQTRTRTNIDKSVGRGTVETQRPASLSRLPGWLAVDCAVVIEARTVFETDPRCFVKGEMENQRWSFLDQVCRERERDEQSRSETD